jgi:hypothetical protein
MTTDALRLGAGSGYGLEFRTAAEQGLAVATPENICPSFKFTDGIKKFSVLSWHLFEHYTNKGWGCSGGLAALAGFGKLDTENYRTWACIYEARNCDSFCVALLYLYWKLI